MLRWGYLVGLISSLFVACQSTPEGAVIGGTFVGYSFSEQPVVQENIEVGYGYNLNFKAYDLGEEARFVVYAYRETSGAYYNGIMRLNIVDPDGNAFTFYRNHEADAVDAPIMWKPRTVGMHKVNVEFDLLPPEKARVAFDVPLVRQPISTALLSGIGLLLLAAVVIVGLILRKRQSRS